MPTAKFSSHTLETKSVLDEGVTNSPGVPEAFFILFKGFPGHVTVYAKAATVSATEGSIQVAAERWGRQVKLSSTRQLLGGSGTPCLAATLGTASLPARQLLQKTLVSLTLREALLLKIK